MPHPVARRLVSANSAACSANRLAGSGARLLAAGLLAVSVAACQSSGGNLPLGPSTGTGGLTASGGGGGGGQSSAASGASGGAAGVGAMPGTGGMEATGSAGSGTGGRGRSAGADGTGGSIGSIGTGGRPAAGGGAAGTGTVPGANGGIGNTTGAGGSNVGGRGGQPGTFVLSWQDDFNTLDTTAWQLQSFSFTGNQALFTPQNAAVASGILTLSLTPSPTDPLKPYRGVEMRSTRTLTYGKVSARMRFAKGSGVVSGLVLFYTPFPNCNWNEIDIEHLGASRDMSQLNCQVFVGAPAGGCTASVTPTQYPLVVNLGLDAEADFHQYDIEWTPAGVTFRVDGTMLRTWTDRIASMNLPQNILLTIWASSAADWAGPLLSTSAPTSAAIDWIKVYSWQN